MLSKVRGRLAAVVIAALAVAFPFTSPRASSPEGEYYYNAGRRVPVVRSATRVAMRASADAARADLVARAGAAAGVSVVRDLQAGGLVEVRVDAALAKAPGPLAEIAREAGAELLPVFHEPGAERDASTLFVSDEILAQFRPEVSLADAARAAAAAGAEIVEPLAYAPNGFKLRVDDGDLSRNALSVANALYETGLCRFSHPNFLASRKLHFTPNDPRFVDQWHLKNTGQGGGTVGADAKAESAWDITLGSNAITVAVADTGIDTAHVEFNVDVDGVPKIVAPRDVVHADNDPFPQNTDANVSHGTSAAGVAVAMGNNAVGVSGIAPKCRLMPIQLYAESTFTPNSTEADAFTWAADNGADVMSNSWGPDNAGTPLPDATRAAIDHATTNGRGGKGMVIFFAAGNDGFNTTNNNYCSYSGVVAVAASTNFDVRASYSNFGPAISVAACSNGGSRSINTTNYPTDYTAGFGGTSSACPLAAGVAALVLSVNPNLTWRQVKSVLEQSADKIDLAGGAYDALGRSDKYGYGRVNARRAVELARAGGPDTVGLYASGTYFLRNSSSSGPANATVLFGSGAPGLTPLAGDWNGDGADTLGLYDPAAGAFFLKDTAAPGPADVSFFYGAPGAKPVVGDWDGDGDDTIGVYQPSTGTFFLKNTNAPGDADTVVLYGAPGGSLVPIAGDWNGDGVDTIGLYDPASGTFFLKNTNAPGPADATFLYGVGGPNLVAVSGDWDNDGADSVALYDSSNGTFFLKNANASGAADWAFVYGVGGATPLVGNWDGQ
jgi:subtilisin family serine protease